MTGTVLHSNNEIHSFSVFEIRLTVAVQSIEAEIESDTENSDNWKDKVH